MGIVYKEAPIIRVNGKVKLIEPLIIIPVKIIDKGYRALVVFRTESKFITPGLVEELKLEKRETSEVALVTATGKQIWSTDPLMLT